MNVRSWHSLRLRLPLVMSVLIAAVLTTFLWVAFRQVERALVAAGGARAQAAADQLSTLLAQMVQQRITDLQRVARSRAVAAYLANPSTATEAAARARLASLTSATQPSVELWNDTGTRLLSVAGSRPAGAPPVQLPPTTPPTALGLSPFQIVHNTIFWDAVAEVREEAADESQPSPHARRLGYVLSRRSLSRASTGDLIGRLVGARATVELGNQAGDVWTNLSKAVPAPPVAVNEARVAEYRTAEGDRRLGASSPIRGTVWAVWVEFPRSVVVAPAHVFLTRMLIVGIVFVIGAAARSGTTSARITTPLRDLTNAAEALAGGTPVARVDTRRRDEIGRLGVAFNTMTEQVHGVQRDLEQRVQQRVAELRATRQELDGFFAMSLDMLCIVGTDGYFKRFNPAWSVALGLSDSELRSRPYLDFVHPDDRQRTTEMASRVLRGSTVVEFENRYACRDGSYRWLQWKAASSPSHDRIYAAARDITEQREADVRIRAL